MTPKPAPHLHLVHDSGMRNEIITPEQWRQPLEDYMRWLIAAGKPTTTQKLRNYHLRRFARDVDEPPAQITPNHLLNYLQSETWSNNTRRSYRTTFVDFFTWAHQTKTTPTNPALELPSVSGITGHPRPTPEHVVEIGTTAIDPRTRLMCRLAAWAGLRCCEIARIHTNDLTQDLVGWSLTVHGKGNKIRTVPLNDRLTTQLRAVQPGYIFPGQDHGHLSAAYISKLISRTLPGQWTAHTLRHRFASRAYIGSGKDIRAVQELLGHASVATTQIYTAIPDDAKRAAVDFAA